MLADTIWRLSGASQRYVVHPHVSFLYKKLPAETLRELARAIRLPFRQVQFQSISAMRCPSPTENTDDVWAWQLLAVQNSTMR